MVDQRMIQEIDGEFYRKVFKNGGALEIKIKLPKVEDAIEAIRLDGGISVIAHPFLSGCENEIVRYQSYGLDGIESRHSSHDKEQKKKCKKLARKLGLIETGGSDNHGLNGKEPQIGTY